MKKKIIKICAALSIITLLMGFTSKFVFADNVTENPEFETVYDYTALYFPDTITFNSSTVEDYSFTIDNYTGTQIKGLQRTPTNFATAYGENRTTVWMRKMVEGSTQAETAQFVYLRNQAIPFSNNKYVTLRSYFVRTQGATNTIPPENIVGRTIVWRYNDKMFKREILDNIQRSNNNINFKTDTGREGMVIIKEGDWSSHYVNLFVDYNIEAHNNINGKLTQIHHSDNKNIYGVYNEQENKTTFIVPWMICTEDVLDSCGLEYQGTKYYRITNTTCVMQVRNEEHQQVSIAPNEFYTNAQLDYDAEATSTFMKPLYENYNTAFNRFMTEIESYDFSSWLTRSLNGFWNFRIFNDVSVGVLISTMIGIAVVMAFLRMFHA